MCLLWGPGENRASCSIPFGVMWQPVQDASFQRNCTNKVMSNWPKGHKEEIKT